MAFPGTKSTPCNETGMQILDLASKERHRYAGIIDTDTLKHSRSEQLPGQCIFQ